LKETRRSRSVFISEAIGGAPASPNVDMSTTPEIPIPNPPMSAQEQAAADLLSEQDLEAIDGCILSHCADRFYKVAAIMGRTQDQLADRFPNLSYVFYTQRLKHLVDTGRLDAAGDVFKMRFSEVRLARAADHPQLLSRARSKPSRARNPPPRAGQKE